VRNARCCSRNLSTCNVQSFNPRPAIHSLYVFLLAFRLRLSTSLWKPPMVGDVLVRSVSSSIYLLGVSLLILGLVMPCGLHQQGAASSTTTSSGSSSISSPGCGTESSNTFTEGNLTHTAISISPCDTEI